MFTSGTIINTDYTIEKPSYFDEQGIENYMLVAAHVSNQDGVSLDSPLYAFYDINYIGKLKTAQGVYKITNSNCLGKTGRAIWVWW